jgi:hypothetical protein
MCANLTRRGDKKRRQYWRGYNIGEEAILEGLQYWKGYNIGRATY